MNYFSKSSLFSDESENSVSKEIVFSMTVIVREFCFEMCGLPPVALNELKSHSSANISMFQCDVLCSEECLSADPC